MASGGNGTFRRLWRRIVGWFRRLLRRRPKLLVDVSTTRAEVDVIPFDLRAQVGALPREGAVWDTVQRAVRDYAHLREVVMGPGATSDAVNDVELLALAEDALRAIIVRAPEIQVLVEVAAARHTDRAAREATGDAMLELRDQARALHDTASAAIRWASSRSDSDREQLDLCAARLCSEGSQ